MGENTNFDVVVVGAGSAGLIAAIEAAEHGASVAVFESEVEIGGSTRLSGAYVALCETDLQPGTREEFYQDLIHSHLDDCDADLSRLYVNEASDTWRKLEELGIKFIRTFQFAHMSKPWAHELSGEQMGGGAEIIERLHEAALSRNIEIVTGARVRRLLVEHQRVTGIVFEKAGAHQTVAAKAVIIASGGFTRNQQLIHNFGRPGADQILPMTGQGSRGDGLLMAMGVGADLSYMTLGIAPTSPIDEQTQKGVMAIYAGAIALNKAGHRFTRESDLYIDVCWAALQQTDGAFVQLYDAPMKHAYAETMMGKVLTGYHEYQANTLQELSQLLEKKFSFNGTNLLATVERYNADVAAGNPDEYQRTNLVGESGALRTITTGPFYAALCKAGTTHFNGGVVVNDRMQVQNVYGETIAGLYAAGEVTGGFHGAGYMSGTFVGMALIFGRVAGRHAATNK